MDVKHLRLWVFECREPSQEAFKLGLAAAALLGLAHDHIGRWILNAGLLVGSHTITSFLLEASCALFMGSLVLHITSLPQLLLVMKGKENPLLSLLQRSKTKSQILQVQTQLITTGLFTDSFNSSQLLNSLTLPNTLSLKQAELVFLKIHQPTTFAYNAMIRGFTQGSNPQKAFNFYVDMRRNGVLGDSYSFNFVLKACGVMVGSVEGREVHGEVVKSGCGVDVLVVNGLIGMYCKCGEMGMARMVFDGFGVKDLVSWNLMVDGYVRCGEMEEAQHLFDKMPEKDVASWSIMIHGYGKKLGDLARARALFDSMSSRDLASWNAMIHAYIKAGELVAARMLFDEMEERNVISWSIMIDGYVSHGNAVEALNMFRLMLCQGIRPDKISVVGAISACAQLGALDQGRWLHMYIKKHKIAMDLVVQTALIDMYAKCGSLDEARYMFSCMSERNIVSWNAMIVGLGMNGFGEEALEYFASLTREGIPMDDLIFLGVLTACSHAGLVTQGLHIFYQMTNSYKIEPKQEHFNCLVDLLGRAGVLDQALEILDTMPMKPSLTLWGSLLLACRIHKNVALAQVVVDRLVELKADDSGVYILLSNICADAGRWEDAIKAREQMKNRKVKKEAGKSVIEVDGDVHEFVSGEKSQFQFEELDFVVRSLSKVQSFAAL
ncbi:hypothetical protein Tsubulata_019952 [Turnera subulata]|uniref:Pentacotripeptide-repeat region of PRORP domain-containing protein n=1 Tax=Turnera subulata TaxID=218843 RepID=A0A9Q0JRC8_9ROSI|nr:hypothetical protein Tsubulata_019952 [Turnera subulata]